MSAARNARLKGFSDIDSSPGCMDEIASAPHPFTFSRHAMMSLLTSAEYILAHTYLVVTSEQALLSKDIGANETSSTEPSWTIAQAPVVARPVMTCLQQGQMQTTAVLEA